MVNAKIAETFILPSQGKVYEEEVNPEVILSSMTTKHEMLRLSTNENSQKLMCDILDDCIKSDLGISAYDLCLPDYQFLLYKLREVTFGNEYDMSGICPYCGARNEIHMNLDDVEVIEFSDDVTALTDIILPMTDSELTLTLQTPRMLDTINRQVRQARKRSKNKENSTILYTILNSIVTKDGESFSQIQEEQWVRNLPLADTNVIVSTIDKLNTSFGLTMQVDHVCDVCGEDITVPFRVNDTFFRPTI